MYRKREIRKEKKRYFKQVQHEQNKATHKTGWLVEIHHTQWKIWNRSFGSKRAFTHTLIQSAIDKCIYKFTLTFAQFYKPIIKPFLDFLTMYIHGNVQFVDLLLSFKRNIIPVPFGNPNWNWNGTFWMFWWLQKYYKLSIHWCSFCWYKWARSSKWSRSSITMKKKLNKIN